MTAPYSSSRFAYEGTETTETSIVRTGGAVDPNGQAQSRKIVTTTNAQWLRPFRCEPWAIWNETVGADVTVTVYGNGASVPLTDEVFMEVEYLGDASSTLGTIKTTTKANVLATGAAGTSDSSSWAGGTTAFKLVATLNSPQPGRPGLIHVRPKIGKASATIYLDPKIELSPSSTTDLMATTHKSSRYAYEGTETTETTIVRTGGTPHSRRIVTTANCQWLRPYRAEPFAIWNETTGADVTVTVYGWVHDLVPLNDQIFMDVEYLQSDGLGKIVSTTKVNVLATGVAVASDASVWPTMPLATFDAPLVLNTPATPAIGLSGGNLVVTKLTSPNDGYASSALFASVRKYYFEMTVGAKSVSPAYSIGIVKSGTTLVDASLQKNSTVINLPSGTSNSVLWSNNVTTGVDFGAVSAGTNYGFAIDLTNRLVWAHKNGGLWNLNASANPATGVGGFTIAEGDFAPLVYMSSSGGGDFITANFGATAYAYTAPSGFVNWGSVWTPFSLVATLNSPQPGQPGLINVRVKAGKPSATYYIDPTPELS